MDRRPQIRIRLALNFRELRYSNSITGTSSGFSALTARALHVRPLSEDLPGFALAVAAPFEVFCKISQNFSPAGVTSPLVARAMPMDTDSVVPVTGR
jgi:hypothetical protein